MSGCDFMKKSFTVHMGSGERKNRKLGSGKVLRWDCESCKHQGKDEICNTCFSRRCFERREE